MLVKPDIRYNPGQLSLINPPRHIDVLINCRDGITDAADGIADCPNSRKCPRLS
jgi:hypothetical protein